VTGAPTLTLPGGAAVAEGAVCDIPANGLVLRLTVPAGRELAQAAFSLAAPAPADAEIAPREILCDLDRFTGTAAVAWVRAMLPQEKAITGLRLIGDAGAARLRVFSGGAWRPLTPPDTVALGKDANAPRTRLTPVAASGVMAELLAPFTPAAGAPAVFLPAPVKLTTLNIYGTDQPCGVAVAIGADAAFFTQAGPLPAAPVEVAGLLRAAARGLAEADDAAAIEIRITAAAPAKVVLTGLRLALAPAPQPADQDGLGSGTPPVETLFPDPIMPQRLAAQLCDAAHWVAQRLDPPAAGQAIASLGFYAQAGAAVAGRLALHGGAERPDPDPLPGTVPADFAFEAVPSAGWLTCRPAQPWQAKTPAWVVCRLTAGEAFWFAGDARPRGMGPALTRISGGAWAPARAAGDKGWAQLRLGLVPGGGGG